MGTVRRPKTKVGREVGRGPEKVKFTAGYPLMKSRLIPVLGALLLLAGCGQQRIILCPGAAILADTATAPIFRPGAPLDLSAVAYTATVTDVKTSCTFDRLAGETFSDLDVGFRATRAPSAD